ncbi:MAG: hypothetical protein K0R18_309 [Bacillales bacterium]|jgi:hypothetical protein|nr:hypothetical protein [Bacillales bacterium]
MENRFKSSLWENFWSRHNLLSEDEEVVAAAKELDSELLNMVVKEAVDKVPHNKLAPSDRMKIRTIDIDFVLGTLIRMNDMKIGRPIMHIKNLTPFTAFINVQVLMITYSNLDRSCKSDDELVLEGEMHNTKLFEHFQRLQKIVLIESCPDGTREVEFKR